LAVVVGKSPAVIATVKTPAARADGIGGNKLSGNKASYCAHHVSTLRAEHVIVPPLEQVGSISRCDAAAPEAFR
jgi:hypothetical protein